MVGSSVGEAALKNNEVPRTTEFTAAMAEAAVIHPKTFETWSRDQKVVQHLNL